MSKIVRSVALKKEEFDRRPNGDTCRFDIFEDGTYSFFYKGTAEAVGVSAAGYLNFIDGLVERHPTQWEHVPVTVEKPKPKPLSQNIWP